MEMELNNENISYYLPLIIGEIAFLILTIYHFLKYGYKLIYLIIIIITLLMIISTIIFIFKRENIKNFIKMILYYYNYWKEYILYKFYYSRFDIIKHFISSLINHVIEKINYSIFILKKLIINTLFYIKKGIKFLIYKDKNENYLGNKNNTKEINNDNL
jgi:hypothetical protein